MSLPAFQLTYLQGWPSLRAIIQTLRRGLEGKVLVVPEALGQRELEQIVDALAILLAKPVKVLRKDDPFDFRHGAVVVMPSSPETPKQIKDSVLVVTRETVPGEQTLIPPQELLLLRDAIIECLGKQLQGSRLGRVASWVSGVADTPATTVRFIDGVFRRHTEEPQSTDAQLFCAGLSAAAGELLGRVDDSVAEWLLALAFGEPAPARQVGTDAALLGLEDSLRRAFDRGLLFSWSEKGDDIDLRRPLAAIGRLAEAPGSPSLADFGIELKKHLPDGLQRLVRLLTEPKPPARGLPAPEPPKVFVGRREVLERLSKLLEPGDQVRACVLFGRDGIGKTATASKVCQVIAPDLEPVWVSFAAGPELGWQRLAAAWNHDIGKAETAAPGEAPRWLHGLHDRMRNGNYLLVVDDVDEVDEQVLPAWLPSGLGRCSVLVLSSTPQRPLHRVHDAISVRLETLSPAEARDLLQQRAPSFRAEIKRGEADELIRLLGFHPLALSISASLLEKSSIESIIESLMEADSADPVPAAVADVLEQLEENEWRVIEALCVSSPKGSLAELVLELAKMSDQPKVLNGLADRALIVRNARRVQLHALVRFHGARRLAAEPDRQRELELSHTLTTVDLLGKAWDRKDHPTLDVLFPDLVQLADRAGTSGEWNHSNASQCYLKAAGILSEYPRGNRAKNLQLAIELCRSALKNVSQSHDPSTWASIQYELGRALVRLPAGNREKNIEQAIQAYQGALEVVDRGLHPELWGSIRNGLGVALLERRLGSRKENLEQALNAFRAALEVYTREEFPADFAAVQNNIGLALAVNSQDNREEKLEQALKAFRAVVEAS